MSPTLALNGQFCKRHSLGTACEKHGLLGTLSRLRAPAYQAEDINDMNLEQARFNMVEQQIRTWEVSDQSILETMEAIPRDHFVAQAQKNLAYAELQLPIGHGETMMWPTIEAKLLQALEIRPSDHIIEVGTGSGYLTALLAKLGNRVESLEYHEDLKQQAAERLKSLNINNVKLRKTDALGEWKGDLPYYDVIAVTGSMPVDAHVFAKRLAIGGRLFVVLGEPPVMRATLITRVADKEFTQQGLFETRLKPLIGLEPKPDFVF